MEHSLGTGGLLERLTPAGAHAHRTSSLRPHVGTEVEQLRQLVGGDSSWSAAHGGRKQAARRGHSPGPLATATVGAPIGLPARDVVRRVADEHHLLPGRRLVTMLGRRLARVVAMEG